MFTTVHRVRAASLASALCALFFLSALPLVVRSQEETSSSGSSAAAADSSIQENVGSEIVSPPRDPYVKEGIPGGDAVIGDFVVGPGKVDVTLRPGESKTVEMMITNRTGERKRFSLDIEDMKGSTDPETSVVLLGDDRGPYSLKDYLSFPAANFDLEHNQRAIVPVTITVPLNAEPGGLYGSVLAKTVAQEAIAGDENGTVPQSAIIARIGTLFFVTVPGEVEREGHLAQFSTVPERMFYQGGPITLGILFENTGSIHLAPYGEIRITNIFGNEVGAVELEPWFVLPDSVRLREATWNREFLFGKYVATLNVNRSYDDIVDTAHYTFWVLPWKYLLTGFAVVFVVVFIIRTFLRTFEFKRKQ